MTTIPQRNKKITTRKIPAANNKLLVRTGTLRFFKKYRQPIEKFWSVPVPVRETVRIYKYSQKPWIRLKLTRTSISIMSDRSAFRGTFRIEANQTSKVELYTWKVAIWTVKSFKLWTIFAQSSIFDAWLRSPTILGEKQHKLNSA